MSFADSVREELLALPVKRACCRRALACGLLIGADATDGGAMLSCRTQASAELVSELFRRQFGQLPELTRTALHGRQRLSLHLTSKTVAGLLRRMEEGTECSSGEADAPLAEVLVGFSCDSCRPAFLRGVFLATATVSDPHKSTHLEFLIRHTARVPLLSEFLSSCGYPPGVIRRADGVGLYYKESGAVEDLIAMTGAWRKAMDLMNIRIEREIRNQENRATNCVARNIEKSVSASARQMAAIERLTLTGMLAQLPEPIRVTARLRAEHPDATLEELRMLHVPPITKSGLNHRLQKLLEAADRLV